MKKSSKQAFAIILTIMLILNVVSSIVVANYTNDVTVVSQGTIGDGGASWRLYSNHVLVVDSGFIEWGNITSPWDEYSTDIQSIVFSGPITAGNNLSGLFANLPNLTTIENLSYFNTANVMDMSIMFSGASSLISLDLSTWDTRFAINMSGMLRNTLSLRQIALSDNFQFTAEGGNIELPEVPTNNEFTGLWQNIQTNAVLTSNQLTTVFDGSTMHGTWVWQTQSIVLCSDCNEYPCECEEEMKPTPCTDCDTYPCECEEEIIEPQPTPCEDCNAYPCECEEDVEPQPTPCEDCNAYPCECEEDVEPKPTPCTECNQYPCVCEEGVEPQPMPCEECNKYPCECEEYTAPKPQPTPCIKCDEYPCVCEQEYNQPPTPKPPVSPNEPQIPPFFGLWTPPLLPNDQNDTIITPPRTLVPSANENHETVQNQINDDDNVAVIQLPAGIGEARLQRRTLDLLVANDTPLVITTTNRIIWVELPVSFLRELRERGTIFNINIDEISRRNAFVAAEITFTVNGRQLEAFNNHYTIAADLRGFDLEDKNTYRITAISIYDYDERNIGGRINIETSIFRAHNVQRAGKFAIAYVSTLRRIHVELESYYVVDLAENAPTQTMDVLPMIQQGRTLLPVRFMAYALSADVDWNCETMEVTLTLDDRSLTFVIGEMADGMDVPARIVNDRTMVPLRFISEFFNAQVEWDDEARSIEIVK